MQLKDGHLIILERQVAKTFFGHRDDPGRLEFINELLSDGETKSLCLNGNWQELHDALDAIELEDSVLSQCILGGRPTHQGDDFHVCLVRPDVVGFIADQSSKIDLADLPDGLSDVANATFDTYRTAAELRAAVVFVAQR